MIKSAASQLGEAALAGDLTTVYGFRSLPERLRQQPTESENLEEIDKFCNALIKIKKEINLVESSKFDKIDNPLKNAPHTYVELASSEWKHTYSREEAAFPTEYVKNNKYWAPVARVDNVFGDRNLVCSCPSMDEYKDEAA